MEPGSVAALAGGVVGLLGLTLLLFWPNTPAVEDKSTRALKRFYFRKLRKVWRYQHYSDASELLYKNQKKIWRKAVEDVRAAQDELKHREWYL